MHVKSTITNIDFSQELSLQDLSCMSSQQEIRHKFDLDWWKAGRNVVPKPQWQVCSWIRRDVVREQQDRSKCRPGAAGQVEMPFRSSRTIRNVVPEEQDRSKCRAGVAGQVEMTSWSSRTGRNVAEAAWTGRNVVVEPQDTSKCRPGAAGQVEMSSGGSRTGRNVVWEQQDRGRKGRKGEARESSATNDKGPGT